MYKTQTVVGNHRPSQNEPKASSKSRRHANANKHSSAAYSNSRFEPDSSANNAANVKNPSRRASNKERDGAAANASEYYSYYSEG
jgi:hypothetical protein